MENKQLYLHIGCGKTGSSALQIWLNQNANALKENGYNYPTFNINIKDDYQITSGNGTHLVNAIKNNSVKDFLSQIANSKENKTVFSSEAFQILSYDEIKKLKESSKDAGFEIRVIAYVRNLYEMAYSSYMQLVKRHGYTESLDFYLSQINTFQQFNVIDIWASVFEEITVLHYDTESENLDLSFLKSIGLPKEKIPRMKKNKVNRSLTLLESELIRSLSKNIKKRFTLNIDNISTFISDNIIKESPEKETNTFYNKEVIENLKSKFSEKISEYNKKYFRNANVLKISNQHVEQARTITHDELGEDVDKIINLFFTLVKEMEIYTEFEIKSNTTAQKTRKAEKLTRKTKHVGTEKNHSIALGNKVSLVSDKSYLKKNGMIYDDNALALGWNSHQVIKVGNIVYILILKHRNGKSALWYFNQDGDFIGNQASKLKGLGNKINLIVGGIFQKLFEELINENDKDEIFPLFQSYDCLSVEIADFIDLAQAITNENIKSSSDADLRNQLLVPGRDTQDAYISKSNSQSIVKITKKFTAYETSHGIVMSDFTVAYPCKNSDNSFIILIESGQYNCRLGLLDCSNGDIFEKIKDIGPNSPNSMRLQLRLLLEHIIKYKSAIKDYFRSPTNAKIGILRNNHLGHNLWNDLTALYRIEKNNLLKNLEEIVLFRGANGEPWIKLENFSNNAVINRNIFSQHDLINFFYKNHKFPIRLGDNFIFEDIANRIIKYSEVNCAKKSFKTADEIWVVFGLRFENRTWLNQKEGLLEISEYIAQNTKNLTIIIDGHDIINSTGKHHASHQESPDANINQLETNLFNILSEKYHNTNIKVIDAVSLSIDCTVNLISKSDFFIAPWGAGLAKYKWISNIPGIIFTSQWNLKNKRDLKIYESDSFRERATPSLYVDAKYIQDRDCSTNNIRISIEDPSRADFIVDIKGIKLAIDELLFQIGKAP